MRHKLATFGTTLLCLVASVTAVPWGDQGDGTFRNPILPADYSDLDAIRIGSDYYAIASTMQFSPGMVVLHSKDLVNWRIAGHVVSDVTQISPAMNWDRMDRYGRGVWAGAIRQHDGKFWVYFGTPDEGYFMSTAENPAGPWTPLAPVMNAAGWDDCCPFWDDDGQGYLVGTNFKDNYKIHLFKLTPDGKGLVAGFDHVLHQGQGREASKLYKWNGLYYHFFSEVTKEGRVPMMGRAKNITGPYEYRQLCHVNPRMDREPNQGGIVQTEKGDWWFVTHQGTGAYEGRTMCLLPVTWRDGWPIIGEIGADGIGNMVWQAKKPVTGFPVVLPQISDEFDAPALGAQWEWNYQPCADKWSLTERPGWLRLHAFKPLQPGNLLRAGNTLTQRLMGTGGGEVTIKLDVSHMADGQVAGLCHFGKNPGWIGVTQTGGVRRIASPKAAGPVVSGAEIWLRSIISAAGDTTWAFSLDGQSFTSFGERYKFEWANYRGDRIGIFSYNNDTEAGQVDCDWFHYTLNRPVPDRFNYVVGTQTFGAAYQFTSEPQLIETAREILAMGSNTIKFRVRSIGDEERRVFEMPFAHYLLWAETEQMAELARDLLKTYSGTGKTFYLGHWEGDWLLRGSGNTTDEDKVTPAKIQKMIDWLNTRQRAVDDARRDTPHTGVAVYHYTEVNLVKLAMQGKKTMTRDVLPRTNVDFVSYSCYDTQESPEQLKAALDFIESKLTPKPRITGKRVFIGEYGFPACRHSPQEQDAKSRAVMRAGIEWGCPFVLYWELYNNELDTQGRQRGYWMIDDKGVKQPIYETHRQFYEWARRYAADTGKSAPDAECRLAAAAFLDSSK